MLTVDTHSSYTAFHSATETHHSFLQKPHHKEKKNVPEFMIMRPNFHLELLKETGASRSKTPTEEEEEETP